MDFAAIITLLVAQGIVAQPAAVAGSYQSHLQGTTVVVPEQGPYWHHHYHASTAAEGRLRGWADIARAMGWYNYLTGQAMVYREQARALSVENSKQAVAAYFERRRINEEARAAKKSYSYAARAPQPSTRPAVRLFDSTTGELAWPVTLLSDEFASGRDKIEGLLDLPAEANAAVVTHRGNEIRKATAEMRANLQTKIRTLSPMAYVEARQFLSALAGEPVGKKGAPAAQLAATNP